MTGRDAEDNNLAIIAPTGLEFKITDTKLFVPVVSLSKDIRWNIKWNRYRSQMNIQPQNSNLNYLIDPAFININRLFVLFFFKK